MSAVLVKFTKESLLLIRERVNDTSLVLRKLSRKIKAYYYRQSISNYIKLYKS
jgi:hypothetical protein